MSKPVRGSKAVDVKLNALADALNLSAADYRNMDAPTAKKLLDRSLTMARKLVNVLDTRRQQSIGGIIGNVKKRKGGRLDSEMKAVLATVGFYP